MARSSARAAPTASTGDTSPWTAPASLAAQGITDAASFTSFYWNAQFQGALILIGLTTGGGLVGGLLYGATRPKGTAAPRVEAGAA